MLIIQQVFQRFQKVMKANKYHNNHVLDLNKLCNRHYCEMKLIKIHRQAASKKGTSSKLKLRIKMADTYFSRLIGLIGKKQMDKNEGLLLKKCKSIHTIGMRYNLDLVFMDKTGKVLKCVEGIKPFRAASAKGAYYALELNQGVIQIQGIKVNEQLKLQVTGND